MIYKTISIKHVIEKIYRDYSAQEELDIWDIIEWAAEALEFVGAGNQYIEKVAEIPIKDHRGVIPCDFHSLQMISFNGNPLHQDMSIFGPVSEEPSDNFLKGKKVSPENFPQQTNQRFSSLSVYDIQNGLITTSFADGTLVMMYKAIGTDNEGFPLIPDNEYYKRAIVSYCQTMMDRQQWRAGKLPEQVYRDSQADWQWFCAGARGAANMPNIDQMEQIKNMWLKLKPNINSYDSFFDNISEREVKKHK
jgi:hypothetical protein